MKSQVVPAKEIVLGNKLLLRKGPQISNESVWQSEEIDVEFALWRIRQHLRRDEEAQAWRKGFVRLTFHIILGVRLLGLVVMNHLHHGEEVVLGEFLQVLGELLHVNLVGAGSAWK